MHITRTQLPDGKIRTNLYSNSNIAGIKPSRAYQDYLWQVACKGPKALTPEKWNKITTEEQERVLTIHERAQRTVNLMKQEVCNKITMGIFASVNSTSPLIKELANSEQYDREEIITIPIDQLGITKAKIIQRLIDWNIFPRDYYTAAS